MKLCARRGRTWHKFTENIEIRSIVGRYLEHSRIYCFGEDESLSVYISSADFMTRNTEKRVEIACPIYDASLQKEILCYFDKLMKDNIKARTLKSNGNYSIIETNSDPYNSQEECMKTAIELAHTIQEKQEKKSLFQSLISSILKKS